jgi:transcriptional regulator with XRE-family HTH domain
MKKRRVVNRFLILLHEKEQREKRRITQLEIAKHAGVSHPTIANWMQDKVTKFEAHVLEGLCDYFQCDLSDLLVLEEVNETPQS